MPHKKYGHKPKVFTFVSSQRPCAVFSMCFSFLQGMFMFVDNLAYYGHLVNADSFVPSHKHDELYEIMDNQYVSEVLDFLSMIFCSSIC